MPKPAFDGPTVGDGVADASGIGPALPSEDTLLNRLPRQYAAPSPPITDQRLPTVAPFADDVTPEHHTQMLAELGKRMARQGQTLTVRIPPTHPLAKDEKPPDTATAKDWVGRPSDATTQALHRCLCFVNPF